MIQPSTKKLIATLKKSNLSLEDRSALITALLDKLHALPLDNTLVIEKDGIIINGKPLELEQVINFKDSCIALQENVARKVIQEQIRYLASNLGMYKATTFEELYFYKSALWCLNQQDILIESVNKLLTG